MKKLVVIVLGLLLVVGASAGIAVYFNLVPAELFGPPPDLKNEPPPEAPTAPTTAQVEVPIMTIPLLVGGQVKGKVILELKLEIAPADRSVVHGAVARIRDAMLRDLNDFLPRHMADRGRVDTEALRTRLQGVTDRTIGQGKVQRILFQSVYNH